MFLFSFIWAVGGSLPFQRRKPFDLFVKKISNAEIKAEFE